jgi:sortase B
MDNNEKEKSLVESLDTVTADDICQDKEKKRGAGELIFTNLRYFLIIICVGALIFSGVNIFDALMGYADQEKIYGSVGEVMNGSVGVEVMIAAPNMPLTPDYDRSQNLSGAELESFTPTKVNKEYERLRIKLSNLNAQYPDLYGWITIPGTVINYPIMQSDDNDYYLNHSYTGAILGAGSIYDDFRCVEGVRNNKNLVIYGHHMSNNSMFYSLDLYFQENFFNKNNTVYIYTLDGMYTFKVFSVYETNMYYPYIRTHFANNDAFDEFAKTVQANSIHENGDFVLNGESHILTLSTCNNRTDEGRVAVHAVLTEYYER